MYMFSVRDFKKVNANFFGNIRLPLKNMALKKIDSISVLQAIVWKI